MHTTPCMPWSCVLCPLNRSAYHQGCEGRGSAPRRQPHGECCSAPGAGATHHSTLWPYSMPLPHSAGPSSHAVLLLSTSCTLIIHGELAAAGPAHSHNPNVDRLVWSQRAWLADPDLELYQSSADTLLEQLYSRPCSLNCGVEACIQAHSEALTKASLPALRHALRRTLRNILRSALRHALKHAVKHALGHALKHALKHASATLSAPRHTVHRHRHTCRYTMHRGAPACKP